MKKYLILILLIFFGVARSLSQNMKVDTLFLLVSHDSSSTNPEKIDTIIELVRFDSSCGNPKYESQMFTWLQAKVVKILNGNEVEVILDDGNQLIVHLIGIEAPSIEKPFGLAAKQYLENVALNKEVGVIVSNDWRPKSKSLISRVFGIVELLKNKPVISRVLGIIDLHNEPEDVNYNMLSLGLAKYAEPKPYSMSNYTRCTYERASENAEKKAIGVWSVAP